jgi:hypothetical protein
MERYMTNFLSVHHEPSASREKIEVRWVGLAEENRGIWVKTWYNLDSGKRFCWWEAPAREILEEIFRDHGVTWEEIMPVELTIPSRERG